MQKKNGGISIIEVLISIAIIGGSLAVFATLFRVLQINKSGGLRSAAFKLAQEELEAARALPLSELTNRANANFINIFFNSGSAGAIPDDNAITAPNSLELTNATGSLAAALLPYNKMANLVIETNLKSASLTQETGIIFRARDYDNYYFFYIRDGGIGLKKKVNGSPIALYESPQSFSANTWYKIKIMASGTTLSLYLNDNLLTTATDGSFADGYAALASYSSLSRFDDVALTHNSQISVWNFDNLSDAETPIDWQRFGVNDLPNGQGLLTISEPYGAATIKKIDVVINWRERGVTKTVSLSALKTE
jgi:Tfp pilus assembly protein PilV